jgi:hypothetical protein
MSKADKLLHQMRQNPAGDWTIGDVERLCKAMGWACLPWKVSVPGNEAILTIPAKRPIKPVYIRKLLELAKDAGDGETD